MNGETMKTEKFGSTDLTVSEIGMGTWELGGREWGDISEAVEKVVAVVARQPLSSGLLSGMITADTKFADNDYRKNWTQEKLHSDLEKVEEIKSIIGNKVNSLPQVALKFILAHPAICCVIPGMMNPDQIDDGVHTSRISQLDNIIMNQLLEN